MSTPKHNVTVAIEAALLAKARALAAQRRQSISALLAGCLRQIVDDDARYLLARRRALAHLQEPLELDEGEDFPDDVHDAHAPTAAHAPDQHHRVLHPFPDLR